MTALQLQNFISINAIEWHWVDHNMSDVIIFIPFDYIEEFSQLFAYFQLSDGGVQCRMIKHYICFECKELLERNEITLSEVFPEDENKS